MGISIAIEELHSEQRYLQDIFWGISSQAARGFVMSGWGTVSLGPSGFPRRLLGSPNVSVMFYPEPPKQEIPMGRASAGGDAAGKMPFSVRTWTTTGGQRRTGRVTCLTCKRARIYSFCHDNPIIKESIPIAVKFLNR